MRDFQFYVTDDRYAVRTMRLVTAKDEIAAREAAEHILTEPHHLAVEIYEEDAFLFLVWAPGGETKVLTG